MKKRSFSLSVKIDTYESREKFAVINLGGHAKISGLFLNEDDSIHAIGAQENSDPRQRNAITVIRLANLSCFRVNFISCSPSDVVRKVLLTS